MQRLRAAQDGGQRLNGDPDDVVLRLLSRQSAAGGLSVEAQLEGILVLGSETLSHDLSPQPPRRAELGHLLQEVVVHVEEERQP